jgi:hypothetical protein
VKPYPRPRAARQPPPHLQTIAGGRPKTGHHGLQGKLERDLREEEREEEKAMIRATEDAAGLDCRAFVIVFGPFCMAHSLEFVSKMLGAG